MNKFHQIPTDKFVPISHDNSYLFTHYDKVANFLAFNLDKNYKNILAKPVQNGYFLDWFSVYQNLININEKSKEESEIALTKYWSFIDTVNAKISQLSGGIDDNNKNWADLLTKVFNDKDNFIYSNGVDICIVWGWKFENNEIYKPNILQKQELDLISTDADLKIEIPANSPNSPVDKQELPDYEMLSDYEVVEEATVEINNPVEESGSFLEFLKWFASRYWWLLWLLTFLIALVFFVKTFFYRVM